MGRTSTTRSGAEPRRMTVYIDAELYAQIEVLARRGRMPLTRVVEDLARSGLAQRSGEQVAHEALPALRAVFETVLREELQMMSTRLAALTQKGVREAAIATRLLREVAQSLDSEAAEAWYVAAQRDAGRLLAERMPSAG